MICLSIAPSTYHHQLALATNAEAIYSTEYEHGTLYVIKPKGGMFHERVDRLVIDIEKTGEGPAFALVGDTYSKKVKSFATEEEKVGDVHYNVIYNTSKKSGFGHKVNPGVYQHPIAAKEPVAKSKPAGPPPTTVSPTVQSAVSSIVQQAAATMRTQVITAPEAMAVDITAVAMAAMGQEVATTTADPMRQEEPTTTTVAPTTYDHTTSFVEPPRMPVDTEEMLREMTRNMDDLRVAQARGSQATTENERLKARCAQLEADNEEWKVRYQELERSIGASQGCPATAGLLHRVCYLEGELGKTRDECARLVMRLRFQEERLLLIHQIFVLQRVNNANLKDHVMRLWELAGVPMNGEDVSYCFPKQRLAQLLNDCSTVEEARHILEQVADVDLLMQDHGSDPTIQMADKIIALQEEVQILRKHVEESQQRPKDTYVSRQLYDSVCIDLDRKKQECMTLERAKRPDLVNVKALSLKVQSYWSRERKNILRIADQEAEIEAMRTALSMLIDERKINAAVQHAVMLRVELASAKNKANDNGFLERVTNDRNTIMAEIHEHACRYEDMKARKNQVVANLHEQIFSLEHAAGIPRNFATAKDVSGAQRELNRIQSTLLSLRDDERAEKENIAMQQARKAGVFVEVQKMAYDRDQKRKELELAGEMLSRVEEQRKAAEEIVKNTEAAIKRVEEAYKQIMSGEKGKAILAMENKAAEIKRSVEMFKADLDGKTAMQAEVHEGIEELEAEKKRLEKDVRRLQAERQQLAAGPDVVMAST